MGSESVAVTSPVVPLPASPVPTSLVPTNLVDIQNLVDAREIAIDKVGVRRVRHPLHVRAREGGIQHSVGEFSLTVDLPREFKGTHMSRFLEVLGERSGDVSAETIPAILAELRARLNARTAHLEVRFTLFREKAAPVTGKTGMMGYEVGFAAQGGADPATDRFLLNLVVPVATLCPCSREISAYGAHNQRGYVTVQVEPDPRVNGGFLWLEDVIDLIEASGSAPLYPVLKRPDEKRVTEQAYDNPRFVEDLVREVALAFDAHAGIRAYTIEVENHESIHDHNAYATLTRTKDEPVWDRRDALTEGPYTLRYRELADGWTRASVAQLPQVAVEAATPDEAREMVVAALMGVLQASGELKPVGTPRRTA